MNIIKHNKLIRDKIPQIIESVGKKAITETLNDIEYKTLLDIKLQEELDEYKEENNVEELADLVEVVYSILENKGISIEEFETIRLNKQAERGSFKERLLLKEVIEP